VKTLGALLLVALCLSACDSPAESGNRSASDPEGSTQHPESRSSGAQAGEDDGDPVTDVDWDGWTGFHGELRPATEDVVTELRARVAARNATAWTAHEGGADAEVAYTPEHVRISWGYLDLHLDPREELDDASLTACLADGCSEMDEDDEDSGPGRLVLTKAVAALPLLMAQLQSDDELDQILEEGFSTSVSTVDTPTGPWDCLVHGRRPRDVEALVGTEVVVEEAGRTTKGFTSWCVDQRGLVVLNGASAAPATARYDAWHPGVDADAASLVPAAEATGTPIDPSGEYEDALWALWEGVYRDVRPATEADVAALRTRVTARNATSWTGVLDHLGTTLSVTPDHVRADSGYAEWHFSPGARPHRSPYVLCVDGEECVRIGPDAESDGPHLTNDFLDGTTFLLQGLLLSQRQGEDLDLERGMVSATVDSPVGPLDCLVRGTRRRIDALEGAPVVADPDPLRPTVAPLCVDQRGLVTLTSDPFTPAIPYSSWHEGVAEDHDTYPAPVRDYGERPKS